MFTILNRRSREKDDNNEEEILPNQEEIEKIIILTRNKTFKVYTPG